MLPFTSAQFTAVFADYNNAVWPVQMLACAVAALMLVAVVKPMRLTDPLVAAALAGFWIWTGLAYHALFFARINAAAWLFAALFVFQGAWILRAGVLQRRLRFHARERAHAVLGWTLVAYACVLYPLLGAWLGIRWPDMPTFGITPCPLTIFTLGLFLLARPPLPRGLFVVPLLWSLIGGSAAALLAMPPDWGLLASGVAVLAVLLKDRFAPRLALR